MKLVKLCVLVLGLGWGLVCWGEQGGVSDPGEGYFQRGQFELAVQYWESKRSKLVIKGKAEGSTISPVMEGKEGSPHPYYQLENVTDSNFLTVEEQLRLAEAYQQLGRLKKALEVLQGVQSNIQKIQDPTRQDELQAVVYGQLGDVYLALGSLESQDCSISTRSRQAVLRENRQLAEKSLYLAKGFADKINHSLLQASILNKQGNLLTTQENYDEAMKKYREATKLSESDKLLKAKIMVNIAQLEVSQGDFNASNAIKEASIEVTKLLDSSTDSHDKSFLLIGLARLWERLQAHDSQTSEHSHSSYESEFCSTESSFKKQPRFDFLMLALDANKIQENRRAMSYAKGYLAKFYLEKGCYSQAKELTEQAISHARDYPKPTAEHNVENIEKNVWGYPELLFQWKWQLGRILNEQVKGGLAQAKPEEVFAAYESAADHLEMVRRNYASTSSTLREEGERFYLERTDLLLQAAKHMVEGDNKQNFLKVAIDSIESRQEAGLRNYFQDDCVTEKTLVKEEERQLQDNEMLVYLVMFGDRIESLLVNFKGHIQQKTSICDPSFCEDAYLINKIDQLRKEASISSKPIDLKHSPFNRTISSLIVKPLKEVGIGTDTTLIIVPSGELLRVPFASLLYEDTKDKEVYLFEHNPIAELVSWKLSATPHISPITLSEDLALLAGLTVPSPPARQRLNAGGDSRGDPLCTTPLKNVAPEIERLQKIVKYRDPPLWEKNFTADAVEKILTGQEGNYPILHFSTHGQFEQSSNDSWLCTYDGVLTLDKLEEILQRQKVKLLTLSACETALGAELGLAGVGVKVGAQSAVGSLWVVDDESTSLLMQEFYNNLTEKQLKENKHSIAKALQRAQLSLYKGKPGANNETFTEPYYWAGFLLVGNW